MNMNWWWRILSDGCNCNRLPLEKLEAQNWLENVTSWHFNMGMVPVITDMQVGIATKKDGTPI